MKDDTLNSLYIPNILIVDDYGANLKLLDDILRPEGYKTRLIPGGKLALLAAEKEKPDLILLDIMMPGMDGFEVCRRIKENPDLTDVPVIFISALGDTDSIVKALTTGGVDYIFKPFQSEEIKARVHTHLKLSQQTKELREVNATKDKFFSIIAHDLRGPLGGFMELTKIIANESQILTGEQKKDMNETLSISAQNTYNLLENLLEWSQVVRGNTAFNLQNLILKDIITGCVNLAAESAREKSISLNIEVSNELQVFADSNMIQTVIRNLLSNSIKFTPNGGEVTISSEPDENNMIVISVKDSGIGISDQMQAKLFSIDATTKRSGTNKELSTGLGLLLCKEFVEKHGGKIWVESVEGRGSTFYFTIPFNPV
jgi:signal transduction histidine kinase